MIQIIIITIIIKLFVGAPSPHSFSSQFTHKLPAVDWAGFSRHSFSAQCAISSLIVRYSICLVWAAEERSGEVTAARRTSGQTTLGRRGRGR